MGWSDEWGCRADGCHAERGAQHQQCWNLSATEAARTIGGEAAPSMVQRGSVSDEAGPLWRRGLTDPPPWQEGG